MERIVLKTEEKPQNNWVVAYDLDTITLLNSDPNFLLQKMFNDDPDKIFLLEKTGFNMSMQIQTWINLYRTAIEENGNLDEVKNLLINKTIQNVIGFYFEYLTKQDIFPISVEFKEKDNGEKIIYASKYNQTLESVTLSTERDGALAEGVKQAVEILINSSPETVVFLTSPKGWSGLGHDHPDNQTYVYWINSGGNLDALTIRTDINLTSSEKLVGIENNIETPTRERIKDVVRSPRNINANSFEAVLDLIEETSGQTFTKQRQEIQNREKLFTLNENASAIITNLKKYLIANISHLNENSIRLFVIEVGRAILDLAKETLQPEAKQVSYFFDSRRPIFNYQDQYAKYNSLYQQVRAILGCNGGGIDTLNSSFGMAQAQIEIGGHRCQKCGTTEKVACGWCKPCWKIFGTG